MTTNDRRFFLKSLTLSGLAFSGIQAFAGSFKDEQVQQVKHWDVIVAGGGPGGVAAALAAARNGARVLLIERYGFLGGMATTALVHPFMPFSTGDLVLTRGSFTEMIERLKKEEGFAIEEGRWKNRMIDSEKLKLVLDRMCIDSKVDLLFHTQVIGVLVRNTEVKAVKVFTRNGIEDLSADIFIDATGDGDLACWAGAPYEVGRREDEAVQPMTLCFRMANVDASKLDSDAIDKMYNKAKENGEIQNPRENVLYFKCIQNDVVHFNTTRVIGKKSTDAWSMSEAELEGRKQVDQMVRFLKKYVKGFENAYLQRMAPQIGVRESRRIMGKYLLTETDVLSARHFEDGIAACCYPLDIHNPTGTGTVMKHLKAGEYYTIPYRCIVPYTPDNVLIASRCISATHEAHSSMRIMPVVWSIGEAAGTAAGICIKNKIIPSAVDAKVLRAQLEKQGAFVG